MTPSPSGADPVQFTGPARRDVLGLGAAAALGITTFVLPRAALAASPGSQSVRTGFVQVAEFTAPGGTVPADDLYRSFVHGGKIHILDPSATPWRMYVFTSSLDAVEVVTITGPTQNFRWQYDSSGFLVDGDVATIATLRTDSSTDTPYLDVVRLALPLTPTAGSVAATVWSVDLSARIASESQAARSWTVVDSYGVSRTISGSSLTPRFGETTVSSTAWSAYDFSPIGAIVQEAGKLYFRIRVRSAEEFGYSYEYFNTDLQQNRTEDFQFYLGKHELVSIDVASPATRTFTLLSVDLDIGGGSFASGRSFPTEPSTNFSMYGHSVALVRSGDLILFAEDGPRVQAVRIPLATPTAWTSTPSVTLPAALTAAYISEYDRAPASVRIGDRLLIPAEVRLASDSSNHAAVLELNLAQAGTPVIGYVLIAGSPWTRGPIAYDGTTYLYVGCDDENGDFAMARLTATPLAWDATANTELDDFAYHYGYTAQVTATGVLSAGQGAVAAFAFVAP